MNLTTLICVCGKTLRFPKDKIIKFKCPHCSKPYYAQYGTILNLEQQMRLNRDVKASKDNFSIKTIEDWAKRIQKTYDSIGMKSEVKCFNSEIEVSIYDKEMSEAINQVFTVINSPERYSNDIVLNVRLRTFGRAVQSVK